MAPEHLPGSESEPAKLNPLRSDREDDARAN